MAIKSIISFFSIFLLTLAPATTLAQNPLGSKDLINAFKHVGSNTPFLDSSQARCGHPEYKRTWLKYLVPGLETFKVPKLFKEGEKLYLSAYFQRDDAGDLIKAPVMIVVPGIFTTTTDDTALYHSVKFHQNGYHVLTIPNPWTKNYIQWTKSKMGELQKEAQEHLGLIKFFLDHIRESVAVDKVQLISLSYGAFLSSIILKKDSDRETPLINGQAILVAPPFNLKNSFDTLDKLTTLNWAKVNNMSIFKIKRTFDDICKGLTKKKRTRYEKLAAQVVPIYGFHDFLTYAVGDVDDKLGMGLRPRGSDDDYTQDKVDQWRSQVRFKKYIKLYAPKLLLSLKTETPKITYWLAQDQQRLPRPLVITAKNDFINPQGLTDWTLLGDQALVLDRGGHMGFLNHKEFVKAIHRVYDHDL